jgi:hypothetical protein
MTRWLRRTGMVVPLLLLIGLSGCWVAGQGPESTIDREHRQAQDALARWSTAVAAADGQAWFVPVGELTGQIGDWEAAVGQNKAALYAGMMDATTTLPTETPPDGEVRWANGTSRTIPTVSAQQALAELRAAGTQAPCPECVPLRITAARLTTAQIQTSRGPAMAPAWEFTIEGTAVRVTRIAIGAGDRVSVTPPAWDPNNAPVGLWIESATGRVGGSKLTVAFTGAPRSAAEACGADYSAEAVESSTAVVVIVVEHPNPFAGPCTLVGARRTATVTLAEALGERTVLEVTQGLPVTVLLTP